MPACTTNECDDNDDDDADMVMENANFGYRTVQNGSIAVVG